MGGNLGHNPQTTAGVLRPEIGLVAGRNCQAITKIEWATARAAFSGLGALAPGVLGQIAALVRATACAARATHSHLGPLRVRPQPCLPADSWLSLHTLPRRGCMAKETAWGLSDRPAAGVSDDRWP